MEVIGHGGFVPKRRCYEPNIEPRVVLPVTVQRRSKKTSYQVPDVAEKGQVTRRLGTPREIMVYTADMASDT